MNVASPQECLEAHRKASEGVDDALKQFLNEKAIGPAASMYRMLMYFMGFLDEKFRDESPGVGGKRFRPALCLLMAEAYGARDKTMDAALCIELFHNFTLIHDDVEDRDEERRNRPTVWKLWGVNHAINSGDMQMLITAELCTRIDRAQSSVLMRAFQEVIEGQFLDFELTDKPIGDEAVSEARAFLVNQKKTGALIAASCEVAGIAGGQNAEECAHLREYGVALGQLFQLVDDYRSVWETQAETGKDTDSDIREHKRTVPFFAAYEELKGSDKQRLEVLYSLARQLTDREIKEALVLIDSTDAKEEVLSDIQKYATEARSAAEKLSVSEDTKAILAGVVEMLVPKV